MIGRAKPIPPGEPSCNGCGAQPPEPMETRVVEGVALLGAAPRRARGQQSNWSDTARMRAWNVAESCKRQLKAPCTGVTADQFAAHVEGCACSRYRLVYDAGRVKYAQSVHDRPCVRCGPKTKPAEAGTALSAAHQDARALRLVMKEVLKDLWREAKRLHELQGSVDQAATGDHCRSVGAALHEERWAA